MLFRLNRPQRKFVERLEKMRTGGKPVRLILLKARQWGGSTCAQLYMAWLQLVHSKGLNSLIIAHQGVGSDEIKDMFDRMIGHYPDKFLVDEGETPDPKARRTEGVGRSRQMFRVPSRNCKIKIGTAERPDSCRGGDYSLVHCSEVGIWKATLGKTPEQIAGIAGAMGERGCRNVLITRLSPEAAELVAQNGIIESSAVAEKALPHCNIVCLTGQEMYEKLSGYLQVLAEAAPESVGGVLPRDDFYYGT